MRERAEFCCASLSPDNEVRRRKATFPAPHFLLSAAQERNKMPQMDWNIAGQWASVGADYAVKALNSNFTMAVVGGFVGAVGGALGAQHIAERSRREDLLIAELTSTNSAVMLSMIVCNTALGFKKQLAGPLYENYLAQKSEYLTQLKLFSADPKSFLGYNLTADFTTFAAPVVPIEALSNLVLQKLNAPGKPTGLVPLVQNAASGLTNAVARREELILRFESAGIADRDTHWYYFGEKSPAGHQNREYSDTVEVIHSYTNDLVFFSASLCESLVKHGERVRSSVKRPPKNLPKVHAPDFSGPRKSGLFPPESDYSAFQGWIVERETSAST